MNPLLDPKLLQGQFPQFDKLETSHFLPAVHEMISNAKKRVEPIKTVTPPDFENTILVLEEISRHVGQIQELYSLFSLSKSSDEFKKIESEVAGLYTAFFTELFSDVDLFNKVKHVYDERKNLESDQRRLVENYYKQFVRSGSNLSPDKKKRFKEISQELSKLTVEFGQNIQKSTMEFKFQMKDEHFKGLSPELASKMKSEGGVATLEPATYIEVMEKAERSDLRKAFYLAWNRRAYKDKYDNTENVFKIARLRQELGQILGYSSYAAYVLEERMAKKLDSVESFVGNLIKAYRPHAETEEKELRNFIKSKTGTDEHQIWDRAFWSRKLLEENYAFDEELFKEYLVYKKVLEALFKIAEKLYGVRFQLNPKLPIYHPDTQIFEVLQENEIVSYLVVDPYARLGTKKHGAWMMAITPSYNNKGKRIPSVVSVNTNYSKPESGKPLLLTIDEALTLFHEFGHALHGMLTRVRYSSISGTNVLWDFVELPSQFMENFFYEKEILDLFAYHYQTNEPIPPNYIDGLVRFRRFRTANQAMRQIAFITLDLAWHSGKLLQSKESLAEIERKLLDPVLIFKDIGDISTSASFSHIFSGGYSAGYYSYKWAEVLDADAFVIFKKEGLLNPKTAHRFLRNILEVGDSVEPMDAYVKFAGRPPKIEAMLERDGFTEAALG